METARKSYASDVSDVEWEFLLPYLTLMREDAPQREYPSRELFNALRYVVRTGIQWRMMPHDLPPWDAVYQQARRWLHAGVFEAIARDLRIIERILKERDEQPSATIFDARTLQSTPESGGRAGYDGHKKKRGSKVHIANVHIAVDTLGNLLSVVVTAANEQERAQAAALAEDVQKATGGTVELAYVDQGYTGDAAAEQAKAHGIELEIVKHTGRRRASCCCCVGGWSSGRSDGLVVFVDSPETTNDSAKRSPATTGSPHSLCSSIESSHESR